MNILSIDFDYFQKVTKEQLAFYPDGIDNSTALSEAVWGSNYASYGKEIRKVDIMQEELDLAEVILLNQDCDIPVMITNSHIHIYDFINEHLLTDEKLNICNVDMHHDIMNENDNLDCGNWIGYLINERAEQGQKTHLEWIHNPVSLSVFGIEEEMKQFGNKVFSSLKSISDKRFDAVFLCRSDTWTPPHLDKYFTELCNVIKSSFCSVKIEKGIDIPRSEYQEVEKQIRSIYRNKGFINKI